jgi:hypothetical protein
VSPSLTLAAARAPSTSELRLEVPCGAAHVRVVRLVAVDAAERAGFDCDAVDDLRIAVDELCHALTVCTDAVVSVRFLVSDGQVAVEGSANRGAAVVAFRLSPVSQQIVRAISESFELIDGSSQVRFSLRVRADGAAR